MSELRLITKDGEASDINMVQVRVGKRSNDSIMTLSYINTQLAVLYSQLQNVKAEIIRLEGLKLEIEKVVEKVILKEIEIRVG